MNLAGYIEKLKVICGTYEGLPRSLAKTLTYRALMVIISIIVAFAVTTSVKQALSIGIAVNIIKTGTYFGWERLWARSNWGLKGEKTSNIYPNQAESYGRTMDGGNIQIHNQHEDEYLIKDVPGSIDAMVHKLMRHPHSGEAGAVTIFTGRVRSNNIDDEETQALFFDSYTEKAREVINEIRKEIKNQPGVQDVLIQHRLGEVESEQEIVHVVSLASHRDSGFKATRKAIDRLKEEVPIFKKEITTESEYWNHLKPRQ